MPGADGRSGSSRPRRPRGGRRRRRRGSGWSAPRVAHARSRRAIGAGPRAAAVRRMASRSSGTSPRRPASTPRRVGGVTEPRRSDRASAERASSMAYIGLPAESSAIRSSVGRGSVPTTVRTRWIDGLGAQRADDHLLGAIGWHDVGRRRHRCPIGDDHDDRFGVQPPDRVAQRPGGDGVEPLHVVDGDDDGAVARHPAQRPQDGPAAVEAVDVRFQCAGLGAAALEQIEEARHRPVHLLLGRAGHEDPVSCRLQGGHGPAPQSGLADPRFAANDDEAGTRRAGQLLELATSGSRPTSGDCDRRGRIGAVTPTYLVPRAAPATRSSVR